MAVPLLQRAATLCATALVVVALPQVASASQFIDVVRHHVPVTLKVDRAGQAMVYYAKAGARHVLLSGAVNARQPNRSVPQVHFRLDYSGGGKLWKHFRSSCGAYDGPRLPFLVAACHAPDGSYWAVQEWMVDIPDFGVTPFTARQRSFSIRVSHWSGPTAALEVHTKWIYGNRWQEVFGRATYLGQPVYGFRSTSQGAPTDQYGRLIYLDSLGSPYGPGWQRVNSFLPHRPNGVFCVGIYPYLHHRPANGSHYRETLVGPGVTPDVQVTVPGLHKFRRGNAADQAYEAQQNAILDRLTAGAPWCHQH
jgi:hypothetical protein